MLYPGSRAKVCDNSGVLVVKCINCYSKQYAQVGDLISVVIEKVLPNSKHPKGSISKAIVCQTKKKMKRTRHKVTHSPPQALTLTHTQASCRASPALGGTLTSSLTPKLQDIAL